MSKAIALAAVGAAGLGAAYYLYAVGVDKATPAAAAADLERAAAVTPGTKRTMEQWSWYKNQGTGVEGPALEDVRPKRIAEIGLQATRDELITAEQYEAEIAAYRAGNAIGNLILLRGRV